jgi:hypothetical protein
MNTELFDKLIDDVEKDGITHLYDLCRVVVKECIQVAGNNACSPEETPDPIIGMAKLEVVKVIIRHFGIE